MASTFVTYPGDGSANAWAVPFSYIAKDHVHVYVNDVEDLTFTWLTDSSVKASVVPPSGSTVTVKRITPRDKLTVVIPNAGTLRGKDINTQSLQALYIAEEGYDALVDVLRSNYAGTAWDAQNRNISNLSDPEDDTDAATKGYVDTRMAADKAAAAASASAAAGSATSASGSASTATAKAAVATGAAATATAQAEIATEQAGIATAKAAVATTEAGVATDKAGLAASNASATAADRSAVAADKATVASDKAIVAGYKTTVAGYKSDVAADRAVVEDLLSNFEAGIPNASAVKVTPTGGLASTNAQAAFAELDSELSAAVTALNASIAGKLGLTGGTMTGTLINTTALPLVLANGVKFRFYDSTDPISPLTSGSTSGMVIEGPTSSHLVIGIPGNDTGDGFHVVGKATSTDPTSVDYSVSMLKVTQGDMKWMGKDVWCDGYAIGFTTQVRDAYLAIGTGALGSIVFAVNQGSTVGYGSNVSGANLRPSSVNSGGTSQNSSGIAGTWKALGRGDNDKNSVFIRIA